jgi:apolipoprotein N-acyltransferase
MPIISRSDWLEEKLLAFGAPGMSFDLVEGEGPVRFELTRPDGRTVRLATPICFEDTVGWVCRALVYEGGQRKVDLLVNLSNDGWFGWSDAGRRQHLLHARMRTIELGVPMVRSANTGLSVLIDRTGRVTAWLPEEAPAPGRGSVAGTLAVTPQLVLAEDGVPGTMYGRIGDLVAWIALAAAAVVVALARPRTTPT